MPPLGPSNLTLAAALANTALAVAKLFAAAMTGSATMLSEAIHSIAAATSQALMLLPLKRASAAPQSRPTGRAERDLLFWSSVAPILLYSLAAGVALNEGIGRLQKAPTLTDPTVTVIVLALSLVIQAAVTHRASRESRSGRLGGRAAVRTLLIESYAAVAGAGLAFVATAVSYGLGWTEADALGAIAVGLVMGAVAASMAMETKAALRSAADRTGHTIPADDVGEYAFNAAVGTADRHSIAPSALAAEAAVRPRSGKNKKRRR